MRGFSRPLIIALFFPLAALGAELDPALQVMLAAHSINQVAISPDGRRVVWSAAEDMPGGTDVRHLRMRVADTLAGEARPVNEDGPGDYDEKEIAWSPDGTRIAFLCDREKAGQLQLYVKRFGGGPARQLTHLGGAVTRPQWSPDGRTLSALFISGVTGIVGAGSAGGPMDGQVGFDTYVERVLLIDPLTGASRAITPAGEYAYEYDWSPDSREIAYTAAPAPGDNNWYHARLYAVAAATGAVREIYRPELQIAVPRWSPDGRTIAFIGGLMSDKGSTGGDIWTVPAAGGAARNLTAGRKGSPAWVKWLPSGGRLLFCELRDGGTAVSSLDPATGRTEERWRDLGVIGSGEDHLSPKTTDVLALSVAKDGETSAVIRSSLAHPPEIWVGPIGNWKRRTEINRDVKPFWGRVENLHWRSDEWTVEGFLVYPLSYDPHRRYPMIVSIHGGPANQLSVAWPAPTSFELSLLTSRGYFVFCPNPRGSYGQGEAFTRANVRDYGAGPLRDVLAGVDYIVKTHPVDPDRLGVSGGSYGGYLTMWAVTQTRRFKAAIAMAGMSDMPAEYGQTWVDQWMPFYFGATAYDDPEAYLRASPIRFIKNATTPTLILAGSGDKECPAAQSLEFWHALKARGIPTSLYIFSGEGHGPRRRENIIDRMDRVIAWFDRYLSVPEL